LSFVRDDPTAVTVDQPSQKRFPVSIHDVTLPSRQFDESVMLSPGPVLGEEAKPMFGVHRYLDAVAVTAQQPMRALPRKDRFHRFSAFLDDPRILRIRADAESPHAGPVTRGQAPVAEVQPKQIGVLRIWERCVQSEAAGQTEARNSAAPPVEHSSPGYAGPNGDFFVREPSCY
jgi:hypothetical protein